MHEKLFSILLDEHEITWQDIIYNLVKTEEMDPWDIDISQLARHYLEIIRGLKRMNFFISGKVVLAAAILLRMKSSKLLEEDMVLFDSQLFGTEENVELEEPEVQQMISDVPPLVYKTPQPRKRKVSLQDLIDALQKALEVDNRRLLKRLGHEVIELPKIPEKKIDITKLIKDVYDRIKGFFSKKERLTFSELVGSDKKEDKIMTFIPLLHLVNQNKVDVEQKEHFGEIEIKVIL